MATMDEDPHSESEGSEDEIHDMEEAPETSRTSATEDSQNLNTLALNEKIQLIETEIQVMRTETSRIKNKLVKLSGTMEGNQKRIKKQQKRPWLVAHVSEVVTLPRTTSLDRLPVKDRDNYRDKGDNQEEKGQTTVIVKPRLGSRTCYFLPDTGLVPPQKVKINDLVGCNQHSFTIFETLPEEFDPRIQAMQLETKPTDQFSEIGGLDKQIQEVRECVVWPILHKQRFEKVGVVPPKGILLYGPPGTGKTLMARAVAAETNAAFMRMSGTQLIQMYIGEGAKLVRDTFDLAHRKAPTIIFIDEIDSVIAATNREDVLDPALMRSGRLDRKIELPHPDLPARIRIMQIHSRKMQISSKTNFNELAKCTEDFNAAQCKAVCMEAGMIALRRDAVEIEHEDFMEAVMQVMDKKKLKLEYYG